MLFFILNVLTCAMYTVKLLNLFWLFANFLFKAGHAFASPYALRICTGGALFFSSEKGCSGCRDFN